MYICIYIALDIGLEDDIFDSEVITVDIIKTLFILLFDDIYETFDTKDPDTLK
jgi:hypothetical protein